MAEMRRHNRVTLRLDEFELEWLRRKAHWEGQGRSEMIRGMLRSMMADEGYLRPPDDDAQDFGFEKEMMQYVLGVGSESA